MTRGQETLVIDMYVPTTPIPGVVDGVAMTMARYALRRIVPSDAEIAQHRAYLDALARECRQGCVWLALEGDVAIA
jgi:hypothetical protein